MSKPIKISYIWNQENVENLFEASYKYQFNNSAKRFIGWFFIALLQYGIVIALKKDVDLIDLKQAHTILRYQIISNGIRIFGSGDEIEMFESITYTQYIQFQEQRADILQAKLDSFKGRLCQV